MWPTLLATALCCFILPTAAQGNPPSTEIKSQIQSLSRQAAAASERGDHAGAVAALNQARALRPDPILDYNLAAAYEAWGKTPQAATALRRFLDRADEKAVPRERIEEARSTLVRHDAVLARLSVLAPPAQGIGPANVWVDGEHLGPAPVRGHYLRPGPHGLRVSAQRARDYLIQINLEKGQEETVTPELAPVAQAQLVPSGSTDEGPRPLYKKWWLWTAVGGGVALVAGLVGAAAAGRFNYIAAGTDLPAIEVAP